MVVNTFRPEGTIKRAEELIAVGQSDAALQTLYDFITSRRTRSIQPSELEPVAILFVSLSVDLRNGKLVKDGLHQYKKNVQIAVNGLESLETVVTKFIELCESKLKDAQIEAETVIDDDLEDEVSPESILLSAVSTVDSKDRTDRDVLRPSLKFLWEAYRLVLDVLRNNKKLEITYHKIVLQAFQFCSRFTRKNEFHRLCDILRQHFQSASNYQNKEENKAGNYIDLQDPDTLQRYLELRFEQLSYSVKLELWQESFRSIEDVHTLLAASKRAPRPQTMVTYYDNLAKVFAVSDNGLFHAAAYQKFFNLYSQTPQLDNKDLKKQATVYLLAALAIPQASSEDVSSRDFNRSKNLKLSSLLNLPNIPTRESLTEYIITKGLLKIVDPEFKTLFKLLEEDFHPITFSEEVVPAFKAIEQDEKFATYVPSLTKIVMTRLFQQLSEVYQTIKLDFLIQLCTFEGAFALSQIEIENYLIETAQSGLISVKIDHAAGVVTFRSDPFEEQVIGSNVLQTTPAELVHSFLANLSQTLSQASSKIYPSISEERTYLQTEALQLANREFQNERDEITERLSVLQGREKAFEQAKLAKAEEEEKMRLEKLAADRRAEAERKEQEAAKRRLELIEREQAAIKEQEKKKLAEQINAKGIIKVDVNKLEDLDADKLRQMQIEQLDKEKKDLQEKLRSLARRLDHTERAYRKSELPLLAQEASKQEEKDLTIYEETKAKIVSAAKKEHDEALQLRDRLQRLVNDYEQVKSDISGKKYEIYKEKLSKAQAKLEEAKQARIAKVREERRAALIAKLEAEKEEEERQRKEEEQRKAEEAKIAKMAEERRKRDEAAAKQREIEQAAMRQQYEARGGSSASTPVRSPAPVTSSPSPVPVPAATADGPKKPLTFKEKMLLKRQQQQQQQ